MSLVAGALAVIGLVWLVPGPKLVATPAKDDPRASKNERFDENRPSAILTPSSPPAPPAPPTPAEDLVSMAPSQPLPPATPIRVIPAPDPKAAPKGAAATSGQRPLTPLELRQQSKSLIVGADEKPAPISSESATGTSSAAMLQSIAQSAAAGDGPGAAGARPSGSNAQASDPLGDALRPTLVSGTSAGRLADRTFMMTQGNLLDCTLDVAISSAVPGMTKCSLTRSVYGEDRKVVLLERGTELTGQYRGGMQQGQKRLFILWVRAKTPAGVVIALSSPGTDSLGRSGIDGFVDTHFWERFGAGLLLSVIDDTFQIAAARAQSGNNTTVVLPQSTTQTTKSAAAIAVENDVHIPPTLEKNQGEHVSVFVARDLDFRSVYALKSTDLSE